MKAKTIKEEFEEALKQGLHSVYPYCGEKLEIGQAQHHFLAREAREWQAVLTEPALLGELVVEV